MSKRGVQEATLLRGEARKIHSVEKGRLDDSQMSQKLQKDPSITKLQKTKLNVSKNILMGKYRKFKTNPKGCTFRDSELIGS